MSNPKPSVKSEPEEKRAKIEIEQPPRLTSTKASASATPKLEKIKHESATGGGKQRPASPAAVTAAQAAQLQQQLTAVAAQLVASPKYQSAATTQQQRAIQQQVFAALPTVQTQASATRLSFPNKYQHLLMVVEELGKDIKPTYSGSKAALERLKRNVGQARILVRECLVEVDRAGKQAALAASSANTAATAATASH